MASYHDVPDHPVIRNMERTGYPDGKEPEYPICPICGEECETIYKSKDYDIVGCDECIRSDVSCYHCWMRYKDSCDRQMCRLLNRELYFVKQGIHEDCPLIFNVEETGGVA